MSTAGDIVIFPEIYALGLIGEVVSKFRYEDY